MSLYHRIKTVGIRAMLYKFKHLYLKHSNQVVSICSREGAYEYLQRYQYACSNGSPIKELPAIDSSNYIWVCWLQGLENAPLLVQRCVESIRRYNEHKNVVIVSEENINQYVDVPDYIMQKYKQGRMTRTHFSDILRLHLLSKYGGVWIDSTILMTGPLPQYIVKSPLFIYQTPTVIGQVCCATGFMASCTHHPIIDDTLAIINEYWKHENRLVSYSVIHLALTMSINSSESNKQKWNAMPLYYYADCEKLRIRLNAKYDEKTWSEICSFSPIHKLTYKFDEYGIDINMKGTFYDKIIKEGVMNETKNRAI